jgi:hypothetical protein
MAEARVRLVDVFRELDREGKVGVCRGKGGHTVVLINGGTPCDEAL